MHHIFFENTKIRYQNASLIRPILDLLSCQYECLDDSMVFNTIFNIISVISRWLIRISMFSWISFLPVVHTTFFPSQWQLSQITIVETTISAEKRGVNLVVSTIKSPRKENLPGRGSNQRPPFVQFRSPPTELQNLGSLYYKTR